VQSSDPTFIRTLKLDILTAVANENNINIVLRELQSYLKHSDKAFATAAIHALGRCAARLPEVSDACLSGLMGLVNNKNGTLFFFFFTEMTFFVLQSSLSPRV